MAQAAQHGAQQRLLRQVAVELLADLARTQTAVQRLRQQVLQALHIRASAEMLQQGQRGRDRAHPVYAQDDQRPGDGAYGAREGGVIGGVDHPEDLVAQALVLDDDIGQLRGVLVGGCGDLVERGDALRQRRKIALQAHPAQQELDGGMRVPAGLDRLRLLAVVDQRPVHLAGVGIAQEGVLGQRLLDDLAQAFVDVRQHLVQGLDRQMHDIVQQLFDIAACVGRLAGEQFPGEQAQGEHVGLLHDLSVLDVLRRHVARCPDQLAALLPVAAQYRGDAEVRDLGCTVAGEDDVGRLDVAVHDFLCVRLGDAVEDAFEQVQRGGHVGRLFLQQLGQSMALDELENQVGAAILLAHVEHRDQVLMVQPAHRAGLAHQFLVRPGAAQQRLVQQLDRHLALQLRVPAAIDLALGSGSQ